MPSQAYMPVSCDCPLCRCVEPILALVLQNMVDTETVSTSMLACPCRREAAELHCLIIIVDSLCTIVLLILSAGGGADICQPSRWGHRAPEGGLAAGYQLGTHALHQGRGSGRSSACTGTTCPNWLGSNGRGRGRSRGSSSRGRRGCQCIAKSPCTASTPQCGTQCELHSDAAGAAADTATAESLQCRCSSCRPHGSAASCRAEASRATSRCSTTTPAPCTSGCKANPSHPEEGACDCCCSRYRGSGQSRSAGRRQQHSLQLCCCCASSRT
jgi:hypothetical protein